MTKIKGLEERLEKLKSRLKEATKNNREFVVERVKERITRIEKLLSEEKESN